MEFYAKVCTNVLRVAPSQIQGGHWRVAFGVGKWRALSGSRFSIGETALPQVIKSTSMASPVSSSTIGAFYQLALLRWCGTEALAVLAGSSKNGYCRYLLRASSCLAANLEPKRREADVPSVRKGPLWAALGLAASVTVGLPADAATPSVNVRFRAMRQLPLLAQRGLVRFYSARSCSLQSIGTRNPFAISAALIVIEPTPSSAASISLGLMSASGRSCAT